MDFGSVTDANWSWLHDWLLLYEETAPRGDLTDLDHCRLVIGHRDRMVQLLSPLERRRILEEFKPKRRPKRSATIRLRCHRSDFARSRKRVRGRFVAMRHVKP